MNPARGIWRGFIYGVGHYTVILGDQGAQVCRTIGYRRLMLRRRVGPRLSITRQRCFATSL
jgi:hypothetical protein